jgi:hypothetical protein
MGQVNCPASSCIVAFNSETDPLFITNAGHDRLKSPAVNLLLSIKMVTLDQWESDNERWLSAKI